MASGRSPDLRFKREPAAFPGPNTPVASSKVPVSQRLQLRGSGGIAPPSRTPDALNDTVSEVHRSTGAPPWTRPEFSHHLGRLTRPFDRRTDLQKPIGAHCAEHIHYTADPKALARGKRREYSASEENQLPPDREATTRSVSNLVQVKPIKAALFKHFIRLR
jgi:hypothetical protein